MMKRFAILILTIMLLGATACSGATTETAEPAAPDTALVEETMGEAAAETMVGEDAEMAEVAEMTEETMDEPMADDQHDATADDEPMDDGAMDDDSMDDITMGDLAAWQTIPLVNARTGETFTLGDYAGKTVFVEPMATWCSNCRQQLTNVQQARAQINSEDTVFVALSVETTISNDELARYADNLGFDWTFAVMTPDLLQALAIDFGRTITNPPSTPHFVIRADGSVSELVTGIQSADAIAALATGN